MAELHLPPSLLLKNCAESRPITCFGLVCSDFPQYSFDCMQSEWMLINITSLEMVSEAAGDIADLQQCLGWRWQRPPDWSWGPPQHQLTLWNRAAAVPSASSTTSTRDRMCKFLLSLLPAAVPRAELAETPGPESGSLTGRLRCRVCWALFTAAQASWMEASSPSSAIRSLHRCSKMTQLTIALM